MSFHVMFMVTFVERQDSVVVNLWPDGLILNLSLTTSWLCDLKEVTQPLCASDSLPVK